MAQTSQPGKDNYKQGHSESTIATHLLRTAEKNAAFILPHIQKSDHILDIGCGPGTVTVGFAKYASEGKVVGVDISADVLKKAREVATQANVPSQGPGSVVFEQGNVLERLPYDDGTFDIVYSQHVFEHIPAPDLPLKAMMELRRVLKPGGILASRTGAAQHFFPPSLNLDELWVKNSSRVYMGNTPASTDPTWAMMPALYRRAGFDIDGGRVHIGSGSMVFSTAEERRFLANRATSQLKKGDAFYQSWLNAGISEDEIQKTLQAAQTWAETPDAWHATLQCDIVAWK